MVCQSEVSRMIPKIVCLISQRGAGNSADRASLGWRVSLTILGISYLRNPLDIQIQPLRKQLYINVEFLHIPPQERIWAKELNLSVICKFTLQVHTPRNIIELYDITQRGTLEKTPRTETQSTRRFKCQEKRRNPQGD